MNGIYAKKRTSNSICCRWFETSVANTSGVSIKRYTTCWDELAIAQGSVYLLGARSQQGKFGARSFQIGRD